MMAADLGMAPAELRLKNLIPPSAMTYELGRTRPEDYSIIYDSGDYPALLKKALEMIDYEALRSSGGGAPDGRSHGIRIGGFVESNRPRLPPAGGAGGGGGAHQRARLPGGAEPERGVV